MKKKKKHRARNNKEHEIQNASESKRKDSASTLWERRHEADVAISSKHCKPQTRSPPGILCSMPKVNRFSENLRSFGTPMSLPAFSSHTEEGNLPSIGIYGEHARPQTASSGCMRKVTRNRPYVSYLDVHHAPVSPIGRSPRSRASIERRSTSKRNKASSRPRTAPTALVSSLVRSYKPVLKWAHEAMLNQMPSFLHEESREDYTSGDISRETLMKAMPTSRRKQGYDAFPL